jgi:hypothetical protein
VLTLVDGGVHRDRATSGGSLPCPWSSASPPGGASVPSSLPTVLEAAREALPSLGWARGVAERRNRRRGGAARALSLRLKFEGLRPLFMGLLIPDRSREKVLAILSLTELNPTLVGEKSRRGLIPLGYDFVSSSGTTDGDDAVRAGLAGPLHRARRGERSGWVARLGWGQAASAGPCWAAPE